MNCKYCNKEIDNKGGLVKHEKGCKLNPDKIEYKSNFINYNEKVKSGEKVVWNKGLSKETDDRIKKRSIKNSDILKEKVRNGELLGFAKLKITNPELLKRWQKQGGGYKEKSGRSKGEYVLNNLGKSFWLQSSYEVRLAKILNELNISWIRPKCLRYILNNKIKRYYADFYLIDYNIYLDPKNDWLIKVDKIKIEKVIKQNKIKLIVLSEKELNKQFIQGCISSA